MPRAGPRRLRRTWSVWANTTGRMLARLFSLVFIEHHQCELLYKRKDTTSPRRVDIFIDLLHRYAFFCFMTREDSIPF